MGNILTVGGSSTESYTYDAQDRLTKAVINGTTYTYSYDGSGNLTSKSNGVTTDTYAYTNTTWRDLLKEYNNGTTIMYDTSGNPTTWYDGATMTWVNGRRLATISATSAHGAAAFTYDASGLRLTKTVGGVEHRYVWENGRLVSDAWSDKYIEFLYDEQGVPLVMVYKSDAQTAATKYLYVTNLQGDVIGITTVGGTSKAAYTYDPYGKVLSATGALAAVNPLRYRGYYYDAELGLYYLKSRYYDPEICRFINADDTSMLGAGGGFVSYNLFAYCGDNPVNCKDPSGLWMIGAIVGGVLGGVSEIINGGTVGDVLLATAEGAAVGALAEEGGWLLFAGSVVHGVYTALTTEGDLGTKVFKGASAFGSTFFCGALGGAALFDFNQMAGYTLEKVVVNSFYGISAIGFDYVIQQSGTPTRYTNWWDNTFNHSTGNVIGGTSRNTFARDPKSVNEIRQMEAVRV